jgi:hypothetical protein
MSCVLAFMLHRGSARSCFRHRSGVVATAAEDRLTPFCFARRRCSDCGSDNCRNVFSVGQPKNLKLTQVVPIPSLPLLKFNFVLLREHADAQSCLSLHCCQVRVMQAWQRSARSPSGSPEGAYEGSREPRPSPVRAIHIALQCDPFATYRPVSCRYYSDGWRSN